MGYWWSEFVEASEWFTWMLGISSGLLPCIFILYKCLYLLEFLYCHAGKLWENEILFLYDWSFHILLSCCITLQISKASLVPESSYIAKPAASWLDDFLVWMSPEAFGCCRKFRNGSYCPPDDQVCAFLCAHLK